MEEQEVVVEAFTELASRYEGVVDSELNRFWGWSYDRFVNRLIELTPLSDGDLILDVATGTAVIPRHLVEAVRKHFHVIGLDITAAMLRRGKEKIAIAGAGAEISLSCGDAMIMPFGPGSFDLVLCGLATHHMNVTAMLSEMNRVLKPGGRLALADAAGSPLWRNPLLRTGIRIAAFVYFLVVENAARAWAEADAVSNIRSRDDWQSDLRQAGFVDIRIVKLPSTRSWIPDPLVIEAIRP